MKALSQQRTPSYTNQYVLRRSDAASNRDFEPGFEGPSRVGAPISMFCASLPLLSPCYGESSPCYGGIISLLPSCSACTPNFPQAIVIKTNFPAKTSPETANSPCFRLLPGSIRENEGAKPLSNPGLILPSSLPQQARMEPRRCSDEIRNKPMFVFCLGGARSSGLQLFSDWKAPRDLA